MDFLKSSGYEVVDLGNQQYDAGDDYPDFAAQVAQRINFDYENSRGIVICGSGVGVDIVANKFPSVRCGLIFNSNQAFDSRNDDDTNVLALAADYIEPSEAKKIVTVWLSTPFSEAERHVRRIKKIFRIETQNFKSDRLTLKSQAETGDELK